MMKMKVHQTLVWLNLLSLGTIGLTEPTIGIQSGLSHGRGLARRASQQHSLTTLIRHFVSIKPAYTVLPSCLSQQYCVSVPRPDLFNAGRASTARRAWDLAHTHQPSWAGGGRLNCMYIECVSAKIISAQKGPQKKILAEFWLILPKTGRKGAAENLYIVY
jgi:hypothetical protein